MAMKRRLADLGDAPAAKRMPSEKGSDDGDEGDAPLDSIVLKHQNRSLATELRQYKRRLRSMTSRVKAHEQRQHELEALASVLSSSWSLLDHDLQEQLAVLGGSGEARVPEAASEMSIIGGTAAKSCSGSDQKAEPGALDADIIGLTSKVVRELMQADAALAGSLVYTSEHRSAQLDGIGSAVVGDEPLPSADASRDYCDGRVLPSPQEVGKRLAERASATKSVLARIVGAILQEKERRDSLMQKLAHSSSDGSVLEDLERENATVRTEADRLSANNSKLLTQVREYAAHILLLRQSLDKHEARSTAAVLQRDRALDSVRKLTRDMERLRHDNPGLVEHGAMVQEKGAAMSRSKSTSSPGTPAVESAARSVSTPGLPPLSRGVSSGSVATALMTPMSGSTLAGTSEDARELAAEVERLQRLTAGQADVLSKLRGQLSTAILERDKLLLSGTSDEAVINSLHYVQLRHKLQHAEANCSTAQSALADVTKEAQQAKTLLAELMQNVRHSDSAHDDTLVQAHRVAEQRAIDAESKLADVETETARHKASAARVDELESLVGEQKTLLAGLLEQNERHRKDRSVKVSASKAVELEMSQLKTRTDKLADILCERDREIAKARAAESDLARREGIVAAIQDGDASIASQAKELANEVTNVLEQLEQARSHNAKLRAEVEKAQATALKAKAEVASLREESEELMAEVEQISAALEHSQGQNSKLLDRLKAAEEAARSSEVALADARASHHAAVQESRELQDANSKSAKLVASLEVELAETKRMVGKLEAAVSSMEEFAAKEHLAAEASRLEARGASELLEATKKAFASLEARLQGAETICAAARASETQAGVDADKARSSVADIERKLGKAEKALRKAKRKGGGGIDKDQLDTLQKVLKCSVCHENYVNTVITKCYHLFCQGCLDDRIRRRNRKCPGCAKPFGADDVHTVYFG